MSSYCVFDFGEVLDTRRMEEYHQQVLSSLDSFGGRYLVFGGKALSMKGKITPGMTVILEFPDSEKAKAWFQSSPHEIRDEAAVYDCYLLEGF